MGDPQNKYDYTTAETSLSSASSSPSRISESEDAHSPSLWTKQHSMREAPRNIAWERRRRQLRRKNNEGLTDEDLNELKGCIELGFGFNAEDGHKLCTTIPALDLYFAVNRQFLTSPLTSPSSSTGSGRPPPPQPISPGPTPLSVRSCSFTGDYDDSRKILGPGNDPQQVKTKLRHWAQAVACSVMQSPIRGGGVD